MTYTHKFTQKSYKFESKEEPTILPTNFATILKMKDHSAKKPKIRGLREIFSFSRVFKLPPRYHN